MLLATLPARYASVFNVDWADEAETLMGRQSMSRKAWVSSKRCWPSDSARKTSPSAMRTSSTNSLARTPAL
jgi:hypothetical protein